MQIDRRWQIWIVLVTRTTYETIKYLWAFLNGNCMLLEAHIYIECNHLSYAILSRSFPKIALNWSEISRIKEISTFVLCTRPEVVVPNIWIYSGTSCLFTSQYVVSLSGNIWIAKRWILFGKTKACLLTSWVSLNHSAS